ncbi:MAG: metal-dependent hydrolase [Sandaracinaceae bacterium]
MEAAVPTPRAHRAPDLASTDAIRVREMDFVFDDSVPTFWADDNVILTSIMSALAVSFPPGERYFIRSVRHFLPQVKDQGLRAAVKAFIGQEGNHTKEHIAFNRFLDGRGFPATKMEDWVAKRIRHIEKASTAESNLARTASLEHFTAILAHAILEDLDLLDRMSPEVAKLWVWHAIEEIEHRSVAFDVYKTAVDDEELRVKTMAEVTVFFILVNVIRTFMLMRASGPKALDPIAAVRAINVLWARPGIFRKVVLPYFAYYRRDFHPAQLGDEAVVSRAKARFLGEAA